MEGLSPVCPRPPRHVQHSQQELHSPAVSLCKGWAWTRPSSLFQSEPPQRGDLSHPASWVPGNRLADWASPPTIVDTSTLEVSAPVAPALLQSLEDQKLSSQYGPRFEPEQVTSRFVHPSVRNVDTQQIKGAISEGQALLSKEGKQ